MWRAMKGKGQEEYRISWDGDDEDDDDDDNFIYFMYLSVDVQDKRLSYYYYRI